MRILILKQKINGRRQILDSFDLVTLVTELGEEFDVDITAKDFIAENFNSVDSLADMIARLLEE